MDLQGREVDKMYTYHNFDGGWYIQLDADLAQSILAETEENQYRFYVREADGRKSLLMTIFTLSGSDREEAVYADNGFLLHRAEGFVYGAKLEAQSAVYGITQDKLTDCFHLIHHDWKTGET